jgi:hypothetical protein
VKTVKQIEALAKSRQWTTEHVLFYLQNIMKLPLAKINELVAKWDL